MRASTIKGLGTLVAGLFAVLAAPVSAQLSTTANGPYYATPSWDQTITTNRFVVLTNMNSEAVLDRETGLVWQRTAGAVSFGGSLVYEQAVQVCAQAKTGGRYGWRLPSVEELASLADPKATTTPSLPAGHPFLGTITTFWAGTARAQDPTAAWVVDFAPLGLPGAVGFGPGYPKTDGFGIRSWCVRGGGPIQVN